MRAYIVTLAFLVLFVACKGDEATKPSVGGPSRAESGRDAPPTGEKAEAPPTGEKAEAPPTGERSVAPPAIGAGSSTTGQPDPAIAIVDRALEATGGLEALTAKFAAYTVTSKGLYIGSPYVMTTAWKAPDRMVMAIPTSEMVMGYVGETCWNVMNGVVIDCFPEEAKMVPTQLYLARLEGLYPLKQPGFRFEHKGAGEVNGRPTDAVEVTHPDGPVPVRMEFYADTGLLARTRYAGSFGGTDGPVTHDILTYREVDGVQVPLKSMVSAGGKTFVEDMMSAISWSVDDAVFERPAQRALSAPAIRTLAAQTVAHVIHEGPYEGLGGALGGMMTWATEAGLDIMGPPTFVYLTDPGEVTEPAAYRTEIRVPVTANRDLTVGHPVYGIKRVEEMAVAAQLEEGPFDKAGAAFGALAAWCREGGHGIGGPPMMIGYSDPTRTPPEDLLNEVLLPIVKAE